MENIKNSYMYKKFHFDNVFWDVPKKYDSIILYQVGDVSCQSGYVFREHEQVCYEISYIESGKGYFYTNGKKYSVKKGDIYINLPGEMHKIEADKIEPFRYLYIGFIFDNDISAEDDINHIKKMMDKSAVIPLKEDRVKISQPFFSLLSEIKNISDYSHLMAKSYIYQIIILMYRNYFSNWEYEYEFQEDMGTAKNMVYNAINYIDNNLTRIGDLKDISDALGYSYSYLSHTFSEETGLTLHGYYAQKRLQKAIELLKEGKKSVTQIAFALNFQSIHSFSRTFKKEIGVSPSEYQKLHEQD